VSWREYQLWQYAVHGGKKNTLELQKLRVQEDAEALIKKQNFFSFPRQTQHQMISNVNTKNGQWDRSITFVQFGCCQQLRPRDFRRRPCLSSSRARAISGSGSRILVAESRTIQSTTHRIVHIIVVGFRVHSVARWSRTHKSQSLQFPVPFCSSDVPLTKKRSSIARLKRKVRTNKLSLSDAQTLVLLYRAYAWPCYMGPHTLVTFRSGAVPPTCNWRSSTLGTPAGGVPPPERRPSSYTLHQRVRFARR
jgi:hypothetical protein